MYLSTSGPRSLPGGSSRTPRSSSSSATSTMRVRLGPRPGAMRGSPPCSGCLIGGSIASSIAIDRVHLRALALEGRQELLGEDGGDALRPALADCPIDAEGEASRDLAVPKN